MSKTDIYLGGVLLTGGNRPKIVEQSSTAVTISPNTYNKWGSVASLNIKLATPTDDTIVNEYMIEFTSGSSATSLTLPSTIVFSNGVAPTIEANRTYYITIVNNLALFASFPQ